MIKPFEEGDLVKWETTWGMVYATVIEKRENRGQEEWIYSVLFNGDIVDTGLRSYMTLMDEPHEKTLTAYQTQLLKEQESC